MFYFKNHNQKNNEKAELGVRHAPPPQSRALPSLPVRGPPPAAVRSRARPATLGSPTTSEVRSWEVQYFEFL